MRQSVIRICERVDNRYPVQIISRDTIDESFISVGDIKHEWCRLKSARMGRDIDLDGAQDGCIAEEELAKQLGKLVFGANPHARLTELKGRIVLEIQPPELQSLRWEILGAYPTYCGKDRGYSLVRGEFDDTVQPTPTMRLNDRPLTILIVVGSRPNDNAVQAAEEIKLLKQTFDRLGHEIEYQILEQPGRKELSDRYKAMRPDILHFIGHGSRSGSGEPLLHLFNKAENRQLDWTLDEISSDLSGHAPAFVFLNACHTVDAAFDFGDQRRSEDAVWSMSNLFIGKMEARALLGMHGAVLGQTAGALASALYESLLEGSDLDVALTEARLSISQQFSNDPMRKWEWTLPYLRIGRNIDPGKVIGRTKRVRALEAKAGSSRRLAENCLLVDRSDERRSLLRLLNPQAQLPKGDYSANLLIVEGEQQIGKTSVILKCLEYEAIRGRAVKYVELDGSEYVIELLKKICDGKRQSVVEGGLPNEAMNDFYRTLNALMDSQDPRDPKVLSKFSGLPQWRPLPVNGINDQLDLLFEAFRRGLGNVATEIRRDWCERAIEDGDSAVREQLLNDGRPFLLALDALNRDKLMPALFKDFIIPRLIRPVVEGKLKNVSILIGVRQSDKKDLGLDSVSLDFEPQTPIQVSMIDFILIRKLTHEYFEKVKTHCEGQGVKLTRLKAYLELLADEHEQEQTSWSPSELRKILDACK